MQWLLQRVALCGGAVRLERVMCQEIERKAYVERRQHEEVDT